MTKNLSVAVVGIIFLLSAALPAGAQELAPPKTEPETYLNTDGAALKEGWNYLKLGVEECPTGKVLDQLQLDGGAELSAERLWVREGNSWSRLAREEERILKLRDRLAFFSTNALYLDLSLSDCKDTEVSGEVERVRTMSRTARREVEEGFLKKLAGVPVDFWHGLMSRVGVEKQEEILPQAEKILNSKAEFDTLDVLGESSFSDLNVTGQLNVGGLNILGLTGSEATGGASIQTLSGPLSLQKNSLGRIEMFGGKVLLNEQGDLITDGTVQADQVKGRKFSVKEQLCLEDICITAGELKQLLELKDKLSDDKKSD